MILTRAQQQVPLVPHFVEFTVLVSRGTNLTAFYPEKQLINAHWVRSVRHHVNKYVTTVQPSETEAKTVIRLDGETLYVKEDFQTVVTRLTAKENANGTI